MMNGDETPPPSKGISDAPAISVDTDDVAQVPKEPETTNEHNLEAGHLDVQKVRFSNSSINTSVCFLELLEWKAFSFTLSRFLRW